MATMNGRFALTAIIISRIPPSVPTEFFLLIREYLERRGSVLVGMTAQTRRKMRHVLPAVMASLLLTTAVSAEEAVQQPVRADNVTEDCSKQVWPNFSPSCLRNSDRGVNVRLVTVDRR